MSSVQGLRTGEVFTINPGELVYFECRADSNPPTSFVWISKRRNSTQVITEGPRLQLRSYRLAQAEEYLCRAFNNVTKKHDDAQFTLLVASLGSGVWMGGGWGGSRRERENTVWCQNPRGLMSATATRSSGLWIYHQL